MLPLFLSLILTCFAHGFEEWHYRRRLDITNTMEIDQTNVDVDISLDSASLISQQKMHPSCRDLRFTSYSEDSPQPYPFWLEFGCNTSFTSIFVNVPTLPLSGLSIYVWYGQPASSSVSESFDGKFVVMSSLDSSCPHGFAPFSDMNGAIPRAASRYGSEVVVESDHLHATPLTSLVLNQGESRRADAGSGGIYATSYVHSHAQSRKLLVSSQSVTAPSRDMLFCSIASSLGPVLPIGLVMMYDSEAIPTQCDRYSELSTYVPRGADMGGLISSGGHSHLSVSGDIANHSAQQLVEITLEACASGLSVLFAESNAGAHSHAWRESSAVAYTDPPSFDVFYLHVTTPRAQEQHMIVFATKKPPRGWEVLDGDRFAGRFPRGIETGTFGTWKGSDSHTHVMGTTTVNIDAQYCARQTIRDRAFAWKHSHSVEMTAETALPPYREILLVRRKDRNHSVAWRAEQRLVWYCSGVKSTVSYACSDHGRCIDQDTCRCESNSYGPDCAEVIQPPALLDVFAGHLEISFGYSFPGLSLFGDEVVVACGDFVRNALFLFGDADPETTCAFVGENPSTAFQIVVPADVNSRGGHCVNGSHVEFLLSSDSESEDEGYVSIVIIDPAGPAVNDIASQWPPGIIVLVVGLVLGCLFLFGVSVVLAVACLLRRSKDADEDHLLSISLLDDYDGQDAVSFQIEEGIFTVDYLSLEMESEVLGSGASAIVRKGQWSGMDCAIKLIRMTPSNMTQDDMVRLSLLPTPTGIRINS